MRKVLNGDIPGKRSQRLLNVERTQWGKCWMVIYQAKITETIEHRAHATFEESAEWWYTRQRSQRLLNIERTQWGKCWMVIYQAKIIETIEHGAHAMRKVLNGDIPGKRSQRLMNMERRQWGKCWMVIYQARDHRDYWTWSARNEESAEWWYTRQEITETIEHGAHAMRKVLNGDIPGKRSQRLLNMERMQWGKCWMVIYQAKDHRDYWTWSSRNEESAEWWYTRQKITETIEHGAHAMRKVLNGDIPGKRSQRLLNMERMNMRMQWKVLNGDIPGKRSQRLMNMELTQWGKCWMVIYQAKDHRDYWTWSACNEESAEWWYTRQKITETIEHGAHAMRKVLNGDIPGKRSQSDWTWSSRNEESAEWWYTRQKITETIEHGAHAMRKVMNDDIPGKRSQRLLNMERRQWGKCWMVIYQAKYHRDYWTWSARNEESAEWWYTRQKITETIEHGAHAMRKVLNGDIPGKRSQRLLNMERMQWGKCWMVIYQAKDHRDDWTWSSRNEESAEWWYTRQKITETIEHGAHAMRKVMNDDIPGKRSQRLLNMERRQWGKCWMVIYQAKYHRDYWTWSARNEESAEWWYTRQKVTEIIEHGAHAMRKVLSGDIRGKRSERLLNMEHRQWGKCWMMIYQAKDHRDYWTWSACNEESVEWWYTRQKITYYWTWSAGNEESDEWWYTRQKIRETIEHGAQAMRKVLNGDIPGKRSQRLLNMELMQWGKCWMVIYQAKDQRDYWTWSARNEESAEWWYTRQKITYYWTWSAGNEESVEWWYTRQEITETIEHGAHAMREVLNGDIPGKRSQRLLNMERTQWGKCWMVIYQAKDHRDYWTWSARNEENVEWWYTRQEITETIEHGANAMRKVLNGDIRGKISQRLLNMECMQWGKCWMVIYQARDHRDYWTWSAGNEESIEWWYTRQKITYYWTWSAGNEESVEWWYTRQEITETIEHGAHAMRKVLNGDIPGKRSQRLLNMERTQWGKCWMVIYQAKDHRDYWTWSARNEENVEWWYTGQEITDYWTWSECNEESAEWWYTRQNITETIEHGVHAMRKVLNGDIPGKRSQRLLNMERMQWGKCWMVIYQARNHRDYWTWSACNEESAEWWYTRQEITETIEHGAHAMRKVLNGDIPGKRSQRLLNMERMQWGKYWMVIYQAKDHRDYWTWSALNEESAEWWYTRQEITETIEHGVHAMRKVLNGDIAGKMKRGRPKTRWKDTCQSDTNEKYRTEIGGGGGHDNKETENFQP